MTFAIGVTAESCSNNRDDLPILTEIPILAHTRDYNNVPSVNNNNNCDQRYNVNEDLSITTHDSNSNSSTTIDGTQEVQWYGNDDEWRSRVQGLASSTYADGMVLRTCGKVENPKILCISTIPTGSDEPTTTTSTSNTANRSASASSIELDLSRLEGRVIVGPLVKTSAFYDRISSRTNRRRGESSEALLEFIWKVLLVDSNANIIVIRLNANTLSPITTTTTTTGTAGRTEGGIDGTTNPSPPMRNVEHISSHTILQNSRIGHTNTHQQQRLAASQISFIDSTRIVLAMTPNLLCIHLSQSSNKRVTRWTKSKCLDLKRQSWGGFFKNTTGILMGKSAAELENEDTDEEEEDGGGGDDGGGGGGRAGMGEEEPMPSTAALCVLHDYTRLNYDTESDDSSSDYDSDDDDDPTNNNNNSLDNMTQSNPTAIAVISLHSDGTVRMWTLPNNLTSGVYQQQAIQPMRVRFLRSPEDVAQQRVRRGEEEDGLPMPHTWSSAHDSVSIVTEMYTDTRGGVDGSTAGGSGGGKKFVLGVCIRTADNLSSTTTRIGGNDGGDGSTTSTLSSSPCHMLVFDGDVSAAANTGGRRNTISMADGDENTDQGYNRFVKMLVPNEVESLSTMEFIRRNPQQLQQQDTNYRAWELVVLYNTIPLEEGDNPTTGRSYSLRDRSKLQKAALALYHPGSVTPYSIGTSHTFDSVAEEERGSLVRQCQMFLKSGLLANNGEEKDDDDSDTNGGDGASYDKDKAFESKIQQIDGWYMKRLFRPASVRTMDGNRASNGSIRRAMNKVFPSQRFGGTNRNLNASRPTVANTANNSIELETIVAIKEWTKMDEAKALTEARWRRTSRPTTTRDALSNVSTSIFPSSSSKKAPPPSSIYHAFQTQAMVVSSSDEEQGNEVPTDDSDDDDDDNEREEIERRIVSHHDRWRNFLLAVWDEEAKLRIPLSLTTIPKNDDNAESNIGRGGESTTMIVLLRAGATSEFLLSSPPPPPSPVDAPSSSMSATFDSIALDILEDIQNSPLSSTRVKLAKVELQIWNSVATAELTLTTGKSLIDALVDGTLRDLSLCALASDDVEGKLASLLDNNNFLSMEEIEGWLRTPLSSTSSVQISSQNTVGPGLSCLEESALDDRKLVGVGNSNSCNYNCNLARCATAVTLQYIESIRRLTLARCLLVIGMSNDGRFDTFGIRQVNDSLRTYLHATAVSWVNSQVVTTAVPLDGETRGSPISKIRPTRVLTHNNHHNADVDSSTPTEPPSSRQRHAGPGIGTRKETALYLKVLELARLGRMTSHSTFSSFSVISLAQTFVSLAFKDTVLDQDFGDDDKDKERLFAELRALPDEITSNKQYTLRLLAPSISHPPNINDEEKLFNLHEAVAECLLTEVDVLNRSKLSSTPKRVELWTRASMLLASRGPHLDSSQPDDMQILVEALSDIPNIEGGHQAPILTDGQHEVMLATMLQFIIDPNEISIREDVMLLSKMHTMKKTFMPWILTSQIVNAKAIDLISDHLLKWTADPKSMLQHFIITFLRISNLMRRVSVLECHSLASFGTPAMKDLGAKLLISAINDIILTIQEQFTPNVYDEFILEYAALWSSTFRHSVLGCRWDDAFKACLSNPIKERRVKNFQRMVLAMVDAGELGALIKKIVFKVVDTQSDCIDEGLEVTQKAGGEIDLYELAADTLADAASQQSAYEMGQVSVSSLPKIDYMGCLYALHAASGDWRRCCHAMDYYGILKLSHFAPKTILDDLTVSDVEKESSLKSADALSLSALACAQFIQLVEDESHRFIVSGELSSQPALLSYEEIDVMERSSPIKRLTKRNLSGNLALSSAASDESEDADNPGRLSYLYSEHDLIIRGTRMAAVKTLYMDPLSPDSLQEILRSSDPEIMDALSRLGYYSHTISLARSKRAAKDGGRPGGRDILIDAVSYLSCQYIAPSTVRLSRPIPSNSTSHDDHLYEIENNALQTRPTLDQLRLMPMGFATVPGCESWRSQTQSSNVVRGAALMELLRIFTLYYSSASNSFAAEVAGTLLDLDSGHAELPLWLSDILMGNKLESVDDGIFARTKMSSGSKSSDPAVLVRLLIKRGLYVQACRTVTFILLGKHGHNEKMVTNRLPEEGNIDYIPYDTIDSLWNHIQEESCSKSCDGGRKRSILRAREQMEEALQKHFQYMKVSETGLLSARALKSY